MRGGRVPHGEDQAERAVRRGERRRTVRSRLARHRGDHEDGADLQQRQEPVARVVRTEAVGVEHESHPRPPDRCVQGEVYDGVMPGDVMLKPPRDLIDRDHEHEVEEELEPGSWTFPFVRPSDPWRFEERPL